MMIQLETQSKFECYKMCPKFVEKGPLYDITIRPVSCVGTFKYMHAT